MDKFKLTFRKVNSPEAFTKTVEFLKQDVVANGGSASEIINMHGTLVHLTVCENKVFDKNFNIITCGTILIHKEITSFEAWAWWMQDIE